MLKLLSFTVLVAQCVGGADKSSRLKFDFIIVGGGAAGSVLANRLSEVDKWSILLLETGKEPSQQTDVPMMTGNFQFSEYNWNYTLEPQENMGLGLVDRRINYPRGRVLGGSTILNYMIQVRGNRVDYDRWKSLGNNGWSYEEVLPYFKKSEDYQVKLQDEDYHSKGGYLSVEDVAYRTPSSYGFVRVMNKSGFPIVDYNGRQQYGVSLLHATTRNGRRCSSVRAFLDPIRHRQNLKIITEAQVARVLFSPHSFKATGVEVLIDGKLQVIKAKKEVILSAGALNTPQILMLSGIGPRKHLEDLKIKVLKDLPVGQKLFDHLSYLGLTFLVNDTKYTLNAELLQDEAAYVNWTTSGTGPLTVPGGVEALAFVKTNVSTHRSSKYPDIELIFLGMPMHIDKGTILRRTLGISDHTYNNYWKPYDDQPGFMIAPMLFHPRSYGNITLTSKNPSVYPKFYGNLFTDEENKDMKTMIAGIRIIIDIVSKSPMMQKVNARLIDRPVPGCEAHDMSCDLYWECALRHLSVTLHHQMTTCKMGRKCDPEAVVDCRLRVHGIQSLRVVDASIIPEPITAHTTAPTYMIAEKASDMIKEDWKKM